MQISKFLKVWNQQVITGFKNGLCQLASDNGIMLTLNGQEHVLQGELIAFLSDTLASIGIGGYKVSLSFALHLCRHCLGYKTEKINNFTKESFLLRNLADHKKQHERINYPGLSMKARTYWFKYYGITNAGILDEMPYFI